MNIYGFFEKYNPLKKIVLFAPENWAIVFYSDKWHYIFRIKTCHLKTVKDLKARNIKHLNMHFCYFAAILNLKILNLYIKNLIN